MSEIKPVAYMFDWMLEKDDVSVTHPDQLKLGTIIDPINVRPLYPAAALEALQEKLDRLHGLYHSEVSKHQLDYSVLQAVNASQAKRIAELEKHLFEVVNDCIMLDSECSKFESVAKANEYLSAQKGTE